MEIAEITPSLLKQALQAFQQTKPPPQALLTLDLLRDYGGHSQIERQIYLRDWIETTTQQHLQRYRQVEGRPFSDHEPLTREQMTAVLAADFAHNNPELEAWSALYHRYCLPTAVSVNDLANAASIVPRQFSRRVQTGLDMLVDAVRREEMAAHGRFHAQHLRRHLPPPDYDQLFGSKPLLQQISRLIQQPHGPRIISIEGLGGIGKTALARAFAAQLADASGLDGIAWISARHEWLTDQGELQTTADPVRSLNDIISRLADQLGLTELVGLAIADKLAKIQTVLTHSSQLIIIDNLETVEDLALLLPAVALLKDAARFMLTSRHTLSQYPFVHRLPMPPLSLADSRALIESELERRARSVQLDPGTMERLHHTVGGIPLALKLIAAQMAHLPLDEVMAGLTTANRPTSAQLFSYIYRHTWQLLDEPAKALLLSLLSISPDGEDIGWMRMMSGLPEDVFEAALQQLTAYSLLEVAGLPDTPVYQLHRLTTTFLQSEILLNWSA